MIGKGPMKLTQLVPVAQCSESVGSVRCRQSLTLQHLSDPSFRTSSTHQRHNLLADLNFAIPMSHPDIVCLEPNLIHSAVLHYTQDTGMRHIHLPVEETQSTWHAGLERGVLGLSLSKHSAAFLMSSSATYPGVRRSNCRNLLL